MDKSIWFFSIAIILVTFISTVVFLCWFLKRRKRLREDTITSGTIPRQTNKKTGSNIIIIIFLIIFIFVFEIVGICIVYFTNSKKKVCNMTTDGVVIELGRESRKNKKLYYPIVEYQVGNKIIKGISSVSTNSRPFKIGAHVTIHYNPSKPNEFYIEGYDLNWQYRLGAIFMCIGIANALICIIFFILNKSKIDNEKKNRIQGRIFVVYVFTLICIIWILVAGLVMTLCIFTIFLLCSLYMKYKAKKKSKNTSDLSSKE